MTLAPVADGVRKGNLNPSLERKGLVPFAVEGWEIPKGSCWALCPWAVLGRCGAQAALPGLGKLR